MTTEFVFPLDAFLELPRLTPGRRSFAMSAMAKLARERNCMAVAQLCEETIRQDDRLVEMTETYGKQKNQSAGRGDAPKIDLEIDRTLIAMEESVASTRKGAEPGDSLVAAADRFQSEAFPAGANDMTRKSFEDELSAVNKLVARCTNPQDLAPLVDRLAIRFMVERLQRLAPRFAAELERTGTGGGKTVTYDHVQAQQSLCHDHMLMVVAKVLGEFCGNTPDQVGTRSQLLQPLMFQVERTRDALRRRRVVTDVNPKTGEELPADPNATPAKS